MAATDPTPRTQGETLEAPERIWLEYDEDAIRGGGDLVAWQRITDAPSDYAGALIEYAPSVELARLTERNRALEEENERLRARLTEYDAAIDAALTPDTEPSDD